MSASFLQFDLLMHNEIARSAMESYVGILQEAFVRYRDLWENHVKLQEKYEKSDVHLPPQIDESCMETKKTKDELTPQRQLKSCSVAQESASNALLELDTLNICATDFDSDMEIDSSSLSESQQKSTTCDSPSKSPVFFRTCLKSGHALAKKLIQPEVAASIYNNSTSDMKTHHDTEKVFAKCTPKLEISTTHHVETTILPDGKRLKQSQLVFQPVKRNEKKVSLPNIDQHKAADISLKAEPNSIKDISVEEASVTLEKNVTLSVSEAEDVIEISPTQRNVTSKIRCPLKLKRKAPAKQTIKCSPSKNDPSFNTVPEITIDNIDLTFCPSPKCISTQLEDDKYEKKIRASIKDSNTVVNPIKDEVHNFTPVKMYSKRVNQIAKPIEVQKKDQTVINNRVQNIQNTNDTAFEEETFYLPAEQAMNKNSMDDTNFNDTENQPPIKKILLDKNMQRKKEDISEELNMRCKADRAKLNGWDCWECEQYYKNLSLPKEELQKRKNLCSRHRHKYERPNTPEGFWDPEFPETLSSTYRQK